MRTALTILFLSIIAFQSKAQQIVVNGKLSGQAAALIREVQFFVDGGMQKLRVDTTTRSFEGEIELKEPQFIMIKSGSPNADFLYAVPGESLTISIDKPNISERTFQLADGNTQRLNAIMDSFYQALTTQGINPQSRDWWKDLFGRPELTANALEQARQAIVGESDFIRAFAPDFPQTFETFAKAITIFVALDELPLADLEKTLQDLSAGEMPVTVLQIPLYKEFLTDLSMAYAARKLENYNISLDLLKQGYISRHIASEACVKYYPNQGVISNLLYDQISRELAVNGIKNSNFMDFLMAHVDEKVRGQFSERIEKLRANAASTSGDKNSRPPAFDFTLLDEQGKTYRLADFRGKLLYIDLWASWCAPCKAQMPYIRELEAEYAGQDIVFASVSLDNTKAAWLKGVKDENLHGVVLWAEGAFKNPFPVHYGVQSIPRFILIDADGNMIADNAPRPQDKKNLKALIDADLYNQEIKVVLEQHYKALGVSKLLEGEVLHYTSVRTIPGVKAGTTIWYQYPRQLRIETQIEENPQMVMTLGADFFKRRQMIMRDDKITGNEKNLINAAKNWKSNLLGLELFILKEVEGATITFAPENSAQDDQYIVLQVMKEGELSKFYLDKSDFLIKKVVTLGKASIRSGGGTLESTLKYEEYQNVDGLQFPHYLNANNMVTTRVELVTIQSMPATIFEN